MGAEKGMGKFMSGTSCSQQRIVALGVAILHELENVSSPAAIYNPVREAGHTEVKVKI